jgi:perosamine synthetase
VRSLATESSKPYLRVRPTLPPLTLLGSSSRGHLPTPLDAAGVTFYFKARNGIWHLMQALGLEESEIVLVPAYNCGAELDAVLRAPATVRFYRVDRETRIDVDELRQAIEPRTRAVIVTHYFGFPQPNLPEIVELCRDHDVILIEDCAHALYSTHLGRPLGTFGDAGIFSFVKALPTPHGGAVLASRPLTVRGGTIAPPLDAYSTALRVDLEGHLLFRYGPPGWVLSRLSNRLAGLRTRGRRYISRNAAVPATVEPSLNPHVTFDRSTAHWSMSPAARRIACRSPHAEIARRRRRNYAVLAEELAGLSGVRPLQPTLPSGACPIRFPLVVDDPPPLLCWLEGNRIGAELFWSDFHPAFPAHEFPESTYLKTHVVTLPIHQDLDADHLARVVQVVRRWSAEG